ncbi:MAG: DUF427 domain-containing protein [Alphaproteobacteria bacterium]|nr:MAG: DUF427 domain-containing protein [Alphaproteobacteria bacterium]
MTSRVTLSPDPMQVTVRIFGVTVAQSGRARRLNEVGLPPVHYIPREDVDLSRLEASTHTSHCPFKGDARYWTLVIGDNRFEDAVWSYETPVADLAPIAGHMAFWKDRIGPALEFIVSEQMR